MKVLFVDDDEMILEVYKKEFKHFFPNFLAFFALNGIEALQLAEKEAVDLIVTDAKMPKMGGVELAKKIRASNQSDLPICLISGFIGSDSVELEKDLFDRVYSKPVRFDNLIRYINEVKSQRAKKSKIL